MLGAGLALLISIQTPQEAQINWAASVPIAKSIARKQGKSLFTPYYFNSFGLFRTTGAFQDPSVVQASRSFVCVPVRSPAEARSLNPAVPVDRTTFAIFGPDCKPLVCAAGMLWPSDVLELISSSRWAQAHQGSKSPVDQLLLAALHGPSTKALALLSSTDVAKVDAPAMCRIYLAIGDSLRCERKWPGSIPYLQKSLALAQSPGEQFRARLRLASSLLQSKRLTEALQQLDQLLAGANLSAPDRKSAQTYRDLLAQTPPPK